LSQFSVQTVNMEMFDILKQDCENNNLNILHVLGYK